MSFIWQSPKQEQPIDTTQGQTINPPPTAGTQQVPFIKKVLPLFITTSILVSFIPSLFELFGDEYRATGDALRNFAHATLVVILIVISLKHLTERK